MVYLIGISILSSPTVEQQNFIHEEIKKLHDTGFIQDVHYPWWPANPIVIPKTGGKL
jgi:hypothetical protein